MYFVLALSAPAVTAAGIASAGPDDDAELFGITFNGID